VLLCLLVLASASALGKPPPAARDVGAPPEDELWFGAIREPLVLSESTAEELARAVYSGLRTGEFSGDFLKALDVEAGPRALLISWSDGTRRAAVHAGVGNGLWEAAEAAFAKATAAGKPGKELRWLKLDVVQSAHRSNQFVARQSSLPLPSLIGIAFSSVSGFAFLPEQLVSVDLIDSERRLNIHRIAQEFFAREDQIADLGKWSSISSYGGPQWVTLFESQSFFYDGARLTPLFRGHRLVDTATAADLLEAARQAGRFLLQWCNEDGEFVVKLWEWQTGPDDRELRREHAGAILALVELHAATGDAEFLAGAERAARHLLGSLQPCDQEGKAGCLVENSRSRLDANALAVLALLRLGEEARTTRYNKAVARLGHYLLRQRQPGGALVGERSHPSGRIRATAAVSASALGVAAFARLYEKAGRPVFRDSAREALDSLLTTHVKNREMGQLPQDEWLLEAMDMLFTFSRDPALVQQTERIALGIVASLTLTPDFPDLFGSVARHPSATAAASRTHALAIASRLLHDAGRDIAADKLRQDLQPALAFQLQAQIDAPAAMYLSRPQKYVGAFRDHLRDFGFAMHCQHVQVLSLLAVRKLLAELPGGALPPDERLVEARMRARTVLNRFPRYLPRPAAGQDASDPLLMKQKGQR